MAFCQDLSVFVYLFSPDKCGDDLALEGFSLVGIMWGFGVIKGIGSMEYPFEFRVQDSKVRILANSDAAFTGVKSEYFCRISRGDLRQAV